MDHLTKQTKEEQSAEMISAVLRLRDNAQAIDDPERLRLALAYAIDMIDAYAREIRYPYSGLDLFELGFCQGAVFRHALRDVERVLDGEQL